MRVFTDAQVAAYLKWTDENVLPLEEISGRCHVCGEFLNELDLPEGPEREFVCIKDRDYIVDSYEELIEWGYIEE